MNELEPLGPREIITHAAERGTLSPRSVEILQQSRVLTEIDKALEGSYGVESGSGQVLLVTTMPDDSGSMTFGTKKQDVIRGHNEVLRAMLESPIRDRTLFQTRYLNGHVLNPFRPLEYYVDLTQENYDCRHGTPLYRETIVTLGAVMTKAEELVIEGAANVRTATLIMSDAQATDSTGAELQSEVAAIVRDMRRVGDHIVAGMGFSTGNDQSFHEIFAGMGIDKAFIFTASSREEILDAFGMFGQKALELTIGTGEQRRVFEGNDA